MISMLILLKLMVQVLEVCLLGLQLGFWATALLLGHRLQSQRRRRRLKRQRKQSAKRIEEAVASEKIEQYLDAEDAKWAHSPPPLPTPTTGEKILQRQRQQRAAAVKASAAIATTANAEAEAEAADNAMVECGICLEEKNIGVCQIMQCKNHFLCIKDYDTWVATANENTKCPSCRNVEETSQYRLGKDDGKRV